MGSKNVGVGFYLGAALDLCARILVLGSWSLCALACSNEAESSKSPGDQCQDYEDSFCDKVVDCALSTDRANDRETCEFSFRVYFPCDQVTFVARDTQACLDAVNGLACPGPSASLKTPGECQMLFGVQ